MADLNRDVIERLLDASAESGLAGVLALSPENFAYLAGFAVPSQEPLRWRHAAVAVNTDGRAAVLCVDIEETTVRHRLPDVDVYVWQEFEQNAVAVMAQMLRELGMESGSIGVETDYIPARDYEELTAALPHAQLRSAERMFALLRMRKSRREVELIRELSRTIDAALATAFASVHEGSSELDLAGAAVAALFAGGVDRERGMVTASGARSHFPNVRATERQLVNGDVVRLELFGVSNGYHSGICRSGVVGRLGAEEARVWETLVDCRRIVLDLLVPGARACDIYRAYTDRFAALGYEPIRFVGHGIGVFMHEDPYLSVDDTTVIEEGMVFGIEPLLYLPGRFGLQIKDTVHVGPDGAEVLSDVMAADQLAVIS